MEEFKSFFETLSEITTMRVFDFQSETPWQSYKDYDFAKTTIEQYSSYENGTLFNDNWPSELQVMENYGNHTGILYDRAKYEEVPEWLVYLGIGDQEAHLGWFDNSLVMMYTIHNYLMVIRIQNGVNKFDLNRIDVKRPFNLAMFAEANNRDAKVESRVIVHYIYDENGKYMDKTESLEFNIKFENITVDYITKLSWISNARYI